MPSLSQQRCLNHAAREAVAQCPECRRFYCRECVVEHEDRLLCASCLRKLSGVAAQGWRPLRALSDAALGVAGLLTAGLFFYWLGQLLLMIPTSFHDGTLWTVWGAQ